MTATVPAAPSSSSHHAPPAGPRAAAAAASAAGGSGSSPPFHAMSVDEALDACGSSIIGLRAPEAAERRRVQGPNRMTPAPRKTLLRMALDQLLNIIIFILIAAAVISAVFEEWIEFGFIVAVIVANVAIGALPRAGEKGERGGEGRAGGEEREGNGGREGRQGFCSRRWLGGQSNA